MAHGHPLEPGARIDGRYRIIAPLGAGGMGVVYRARDERLGRQVALKTLPGERLGRQVALKTLPGERVGDDRARARLIREAKSAANIEHPGIGQVYDVGETEDGGAYLVMELVRGQTLRTLMKNGAIEREELLSVIAQTAEALDHAHAQGVIHRDIKPDNVMVRDDGRAVLLDFGLAKDLGPAVADTATPDTPPSEDHITKEGTLIGTLSYLAPEQARGQTVPASDQFALATTAYEALTGRVPWDGSNAAAVLAKILVDDAPAPSSFESSVPPAVDRVFERALAKSPEDRYPNAGAFARALREAFETTERQTAPTKSDAGPVVRPRTSDDARSTFVGRIPAIAGFVFIAIAIGMIVSLLWPEPQPEVATGIGERAVIGCPVLRASGVPEPAGWLGAMGADLACARLAWHLGGDPARTRVPAELAELPPIAGDDFPADPWTQDGARDRTLAAARELDGWIDGSVALEDDGTFSAALVLVGPQGELARGEGSGRALYLAVGEAIEAIVDGGALPVRERVDLALRPWIGVERTETAILFDELSLASLSGVGVEERCARLIALGDEIALIRGEIRRVCLRWSVEEARALMPAPLDESTLATLALTAPEHVEELPPDRVRAFADRLRTARERESSPYARATLAKAEIELWEQLDERDRARDLLMTAARDQPRDWLLRVHLVRSLLRTPGAFAATRALAAWRPGVPEAWRTLALPVFHDPERALPYARRAYQSGGALALHGIYLADVLLRLGRREEVRAIAARYATSGPQSRLAGEYLRARVEISEQRFGAAYERMRELLADRAELGRLLDGDVDCLRWYLQLAEILGKSAEAADPLAQRFVLADPPRLVLDQPHYELPATKLCLHASPEIARPCIARLIALAESARSGRIDGAAQFLAGAERLLAGDDRGAVDAWRSIALRHGPYLPVDVFDRAGEHDLARRIDALPRDDFAGATLATVREAERAHAAGDDTRARELAQRVVRAWSVADVPVPAAARMREMLAD